MGRRAAPETAYQFLPRRRLSSRSRSLSVAVTGALAPYRIIDLTREMGAVCTRMLAGLGADVVRVELPGGDATRMRAPLIGEGEGLSAWWAQMHAGKRSITLDAGSAADAAFLLDLCASADAVVVSPDDRGGVWPLDLEELAERAPRVVRTVITPFGLEGPKAGWVGSDLVGLASGGLMSLCGDADRAPLRVAVEQAYALVGAQACVGTLLALRARTLTGRGQLVDVSTQAAVANALGNARLYYAMGGLVAKRAGAVARSARRDAAHLRIGGRVRGVLAAAGQHPGAGALVRRGGASRECSTRKSGRDTRSWGATCRRRRRWRRWRRRSGGSSPRGARTSWGRRGSRGGS